MTDFNVYWVALPTGGRYRLLAVCNCCKVQEACDGRQCAVKEAQRWRNCKRSSWECNGDTEQKCNWGHGKMSGHRSVTGALLDGSLECMVCTWAWECHYKVNNQPVPEWVMASIKFKV